MGRARRALHGALHRLSPRPFITDLDRLAGISLFHPSSSNKTSFGSVLHNDAPGRPFRIISRIRISLLKRSRQVAGSGSAAVGDPEHHSIPAKMSDPDPIP